MLWYPLANFSFAKTLKSIKNLDANKEFLLGCCINAVVPFDRVMACTVCVCWETMPAVAMEIDPRVTVFPSSLVCMSFWREDYVKFLNICCNHRKLRTMRFLPYRNVSKRCSRHGKQCGPWADCSLIWVYTVCQDLFVQKFRSITIIVFQFRVMAAIPPVAMELDPRATAFPFSLVCMSFWRNDLSLNRVKARKWKVLHMRKA